MQYEPSRKRRKKQGKKIDTQRPVKRKGINLADTRQRGK